MAVNPSQKPEALNNPMQRANEINDPQFSNEQGYFPYDLTHQEIISPLFGQVTPSMHLLTAPADRIVMQDNTKLIRNQIDGNLLSKLNQYIDSFFVSMRTMLPNNYEKLIINPTKGDDLPNSALPQIPFSAFVRDWWHSQNTIVFKYSPLNFDIEDSATYSEILNITTQDYLPDFYEEIRDMAFSYAISRVTLLATILSRGQLLDYLGVQYDTESDESWNQFQYSIDLYFQRLAELVEQAGYRFAYEIDVPLSSDVVTYEPNLQRTLNFYDSFSDSFDLSRFRAVLSEIFERGKMFHIPGLYNTESEVYTLFLESFALFRDEIERIFSYSVDDSYISNLNTSTNPFEIGHISPLPMLAYQLCISQYYTNNSVDNIFNSDLFMQLLRAVMFPNEDTAFSREPTFSYNGVSTEYDYASAGAFYYSLLSDEIVGRMNRGYVYSTLMFLLRRSLRYGDYFSTARPRMLAVGQLGVNVENGMVSPIDITRNLLMQRYLNAANYIGSGFLPYFASIYGVTPSDTSPIPRYVSHRTIEIGNQITNNTSSNQGAQTTNLIGLSDDTAFDVFIDDHGILLNLMSFDVLPVYTSGIDSNFHLADRFDFFNPMLQNIGDEPIKLSELHGNDLNQRQQFGWTMRNKGYKFKVSRAHGFFNTRESAGFLVKYPYRNFVVFGDSRPKIDSDFIRDKPYYLDSVLGSMSGVSPATYWHFLVSCTNRVQCARKIQATPPVLF